MNPTEIIRQRLSASPLYKADQIVFFKQDDGNSYMHWQTRLVPGNPYRRGSYFDAQITNGMFYLLHIQIEEYVRGSGLGFQLYNIIEQLARDFNCHTLEMTPSGWTATKETRMSYVCRKLKYEQKGIVAIKRLTASVAQLAE